MNGAKIRCTSTHTSQEGARLHLAAHVGAYNFSIKHIILAKEDSPSPKAMVKKRGNQYVAEFYGVLPAERGTLGTWALEIIAVAPMFIGLSPSVEDFMCLNELSGGSGHIFNSHWRILLNFAWHHRTHVVEAIEEATKSLEGEKSEQ